MSELTMIYLGAINVITFGMFGWDKSRARAQASRTPEAQLILLSMLGGFPAGWIAMSTFRHKTQKRSFQLKMAGATLVCCAAVGYWLWR